MPDSERASLSAWELRVLRGVIEVGFDDTTHYGYNDELRSIGWVTSGRLSAHLRAESFLTRKSLRRLADAGYLDRTYRDDVEYFRVSALGRTEITPSDDSMEPANPGGGLQSKLTDEQIVKILKILSQIQDLSESIDDNFERSQISGLVRSISILIQLPEVPKQGILSLIRDPAFANIVQLGTFFAAIVAAVK